MEALILLSVVFWLGFEIVQLLVAERLVGVKQIETGEDPRAKRPGEFYAALLGIGILAYWFWMILMLWPKPARLQIVCMLTISMLGYSLRRNNGLKWILVILTIESAIRIGMLVSIFITLWRRI